MVQESLISALKEEGVEEVSYESFDHNLHMAVQTVPADDEHPADSIVQVFQKATNFTNVYYVLQWLL